MIRTNTTTTLSGPGAPALVDPTFLLVVNTAPDASDPVMFAPPNSAVNLTQFHVFTWANVQGFLLPRTQRGIMVNGGGFYLVPVLTWNETDETVSNTPGTWSLRYIMSEALAKRMGAVRTQLQSRLLCQEER
ncbi:hypothetical protein QBC46DRAFT_383372 [Diplogelasinospora grovesii]|uniref:Uncharacterized protein n=1 Tax=Diplogelasinospora grovesii TaxID=303347 RepID=A0AAN6S4T8_9PEZI|nr:hypothetical protein QBC46DRAFT_383372 [Diplogelasinospora grovesii]